MVPMGRIELPTSPLPRECSTPELHGLNYFGAGEGNRTLTVSLEGFCSTIELHPLTYMLFSAPILIGFLVEGEGFEPSKLSQQIYSLPPLTARESLLKRNAILDSYFFAVKCVFYFFAAEKLAY